MFDTIATFWLSGWWRQGLCWVMLGVFSLLFLATIINTPLVWYSDLKLVKAHPDVTAEIPIDHEQRADLIQQIPEWHIFGNAAKSDVAAILPITSLQLRLLGVVRAIPSNQSSVLISEAGQAGNVYLVGDMLPAGVKVNAIIDEGVILENAGRLEKLPLQRQPLSFQGMPKKLLREE